MWPSPFTSARARRGVVAALVVAAATVVPVRTAWGVPAVRLTEVAVAPGSVAPLAHPSSHLGVRWHGDDGDALQLRWRGPAGGWSAWSPVTISHDLGDEAAGIVLSGLLLADDAVAAQVRAVAGTPEDIEVVGIDTRHGPRRLVVERPPAVEPAGAQTVDRVPQPAVVSRAQWGADEALRRPEPQEFRPITKMAVHHTATAEGPDPAATVRAIYAYHVQANGWNDIGYNFLVDSSGRVYEGRYARAYRSGEIPTGESEDRQGVVGAHAAGNNHGSVGIALLGDFSGLLGPSGGAVDALTRLLAWKADRHLIDPQGTASWANGVLPTIVGHRDIGATACPGDRLYDRLPQLRQAVASTLAAAGVRRKTSGYWLLSRNSTVYNFGEAGLLSLPLLIPTPARSIAATPSGNGYWMLSANGRVSTFGDAPMLGSTEGMQLNAPAVRLEPTPTGKGYWVQAADGGIFSFGDAAFHGSTGSMKLNAPVVSMAATPTGRGYWLLAGDGGVFTFGDAAFHGSTGSMKLNAPVVSMAPHPTGHGYWLQAADGGIFSFGVVDFHGSVPGLGLTGTAPTVQIRSGPRGTGYYVLGADGGVFTFGDLPYLGAVPGLSGDAAAVDLALKLS